MKFLSSHLLRWTIGIALFFVVISLVVSYPTAWKWGRTPLTPSAPEDQHDQETVQKMEQTYQLTREQALATKNVMLCNVLPEIYLPYRRNARGEIMYISSQKDGPVVPDRYSYWPRTQCIYAYAQAYGPSICTNIFSIAAQQKDCLREAQEAPTDRYQTLKGYPQTAGDRIGRKTFFSTISKKPLSYFIFYPDKPVRGILIYLHGAGGGLEQGTLDGTYMDNFKKLKDLLKTDLSYLYVTPSLSDFSAGGGQDTNDLAQELNKAYPGVPIYLAGASAGGRTLFYALQTTPSLFAGAIALCPAVDAAMSIRALSDVSTAQKIPLWIVQGQQDQLVSPQQVDVFVQRLKDAHMRLTYEKIPGDHGAPIDQIDWKKALEFFQTSPY